MNAINNKKGYISLMSTLVIGAVVSVVTISILWISAVSAQNSVIRGNGIQARALADACAEYALQQIRDSSSFSGSGNITLDGNTCSYSVSTGGGGSRTISTTGTVDQSAIDLVVLVDAITPAINITAWTYQ